MTKMNWDKAKAWQKMKQQPSSPNTKSPTLKMATEKQLSYLKSLGYDGTLDLTSAQASDRIKEIIKNKMNDNSANKKNSGHYPGKNKLQVTLIGGPRDGEKMYVGKTIKFVTLNARTRDDFDTDNPIPLYVQVDYAKGDDGNFYYVDPNN